MNGPKPDWLRVTLPSGTLCGSVGSLLARKGLHTVCESARCPNKAECWGSGTATFLILGNTCTRSCRFCAVPSGRTGDKVDPDEPRKLAEAVGELCLSYAVLTCVDRDDLPDRGAGHFAACVRTIRKSNPGVRVEVLIPDYHEGEIEPVLEAGPDSVAHNVETIPRLQRIRDVRASYEASLHTLRLVAAAGVPVVKSSLLLGLGESRPEVLAVLDDLRMAGCNGVVLGQYLQPTAAQAPVTEWVLPAAFADLAREARARGFTAVVSGPLARTSYHASRAFREGGTP
ncbi:MAG TPA: lipoyl synthase [Magnetospirillaceae bacterium]|nr:lipoyl synthase [Magnetospirillaceae bacterium]